MYVGGQLFLNVCSYKCGNSQKQMTVMSKVSFTFFIIGYE